MFLFYCIEKGMFLANVISLRAPFSLVRRHVGTHISPRCLPVTKSTVETTVTILYVWISMLSRYITLFLQECYLHAKQFLYYPLSLGLKTCDIYLSQVFCTLWILRVGGCDA
jgi:hypothetical protein